MPGGEVPWASHVQYLSTCRALPLQVHDVRRYQTPWSIQDAPRLSSRSWLSVPMTSSLSIRIGRPINATSDQHRRTNVFIAWLFGPVRAKSGGGLHTTQLAALRHSGSPALGSAGDSLLARAWVFSG